MCVCVCVCVVWCGLDLLSISFGACGIIACTVRPAGRSILHLSSCCWLHKYFYPSSPAHPLHLFLPHYTTSTMAFLPLALFFLCLFALPPGSLTADPPPPLFNPRISHTSTGTDYHSPPLQFSPSSSAPPTPPTQPLFVDGTSGDGGEHGVYVPDRSVYEDEDRLSSQVSWFSGRAQQLDDQGERFRFIEDPLRHPSSSFQLPQLPSSGKEKGEGKGSRRLFSVRQR